MSCVFLIARKHTNLIPVLTNQHTYCNLYLIDKGCCCPYICGKNYMLVIVYTLNNTLFVHLDTIVRSGKILILNSKGRIMNTIPLINTDFYTSILNIPAGKYLVRIETENKVENKYVYVNKDTAGSFNNTNDKSLHPPK